MAKLPNGSSGLSGSENSQDSTDLDTTKDQSTSTGGQSGDNIGNDPKLSNDAQNDPSAGGLKASTGNESLVSATQANTTENTPAGGPDNAKTSLETDNEQMLKDKSTALFAQFSVDGTLPDDPTKRDVAVNKLREIVKRMPDKPDPSGVLFGYGGVIFRTGDLLSIFGKDK